MANHVYNQIEIIAETSEIATSILHLLSEGDGSFSDIDRVLRILGKRIGRKNIFRWCFEIGTKWVEFTIERDQTNPAVLRLVGDSAWSPPIGFLRLISRRFNCRISCLYLDTLQPFAGFFSYHNGREIENIHRQDTNAATELLINHLGVDKAMECWGLDPSDVLERQKFIEGDPPLVMIV